MPAAPRRILRGTLISDGRRMSEAAVITQEASVIWSGHAEQVPEEMLHGAEDAGPEGEGDSRDHEVIIAPGLVDQHHHGCFGMDFGSSDEHTIRATLPALHATGTTSVVASLVTATIPHLVQRIELLAPLVREGLLAGIHLEGPFLAAGRCGAHDPQLLRHPADVDLAALLSSGAGTLRSITYGPELRGASELASIALDHGLIPSVGHTQAPFDVAAAALSSTRNLLHAAKASSSLAGRRPTVTHLFNGMDPMHHRAPGTLAASLQAAARSEAVVEVIADGAHMADETAAAVFDMVGARNVALITDSMAAAGLADGAYRLGTLDVVVTDGVARLAPPEGTPPGEPLTTSIAGGTATLLDVVRRTAAAGVPLVAALESASSVPAKALGLHRPGVGGAPAAPVGTLQAGATADLVVLRRGAGADGDAAGVASRAGSSGIELVEVLRGGESVPLAR